MKNYSVLVQFYDEGKPAQVFSCLTQAEDEISAKAQAVGLAVRFNENDLEYEFDDEYDVISIEELEDGVL